LYLAFTVDAYIERVTVTRSPVNDLRSSLCVEVVSCSEAVESTRSHLSNYTHTQTHTQCCISRDAVISEAVVYLVE